MTIRQEVRSAISNAYYGARNEGRTMEQAADDATRDVLALLAGRIGDFATSHPSREFTSGFEVAKDRLRSLVE